ncbi:MAG: DUF4197 domain-containing protein [Gammaproteobacteria bacterium]|nr:DUF4197 domain-containing protein [Gammaproteobacteria bacterium]
MNFIKLIFVTIALSLPQLSLAGWGDFVNDVKQTIKEKTGADTSSNLSDETIVKGLKQALNQGVDKSVRQLGKANGFLKDPQVKIPMPKSLKKVDKGLRKMGQEKVADKFISTMNHAAEKAVPGTVDILVGAVKAMTVKDAVNILKGDDDAATQYFKRTSTPKLRVAIKPVVQKSTSSVGLTDSYKKMISKAGFLSKYIDHDSLDIDQYITDRAIDGLFIKIALEEKRIRQDPVARTTDILKQVFGN